MAQKNPKKKTRTRSIPIEESTLQQGIPALREHHYELHIGPAQAPHEVRHVGSAKVDDAKKKLSEALRRFQQNRGIQRSNPQDQNDDQQKSSRKLSTKVWNILEWLATSALLFLLIFFVINFSSYSQLLMLKLDQLRGEYRLSPYIEQFLQPSADQQTQELLPIAKTTDESKKQIPAITMSIAPPDDRVIIPRINQSVPIVKVSTENLIKRDWNALEKDIQNALQDGVVHYPGTAVPGEHGNVVITGHSSYFPWDPGRFKDVFALLHEVNVGDTVLVYYNQQKFTYRVNEKKVVLPSQVDVLTQGGSDKLTLITCTPVGTNLKRLIVIAEPVQT